MLGDAAKEIVKDVGIKIGNRLTLSALEQVPGRVLIEINKRVGFRLLTEAGERGAINLVKVVPLIGGVVGGSFDAAMCIGVGKTAKRIFRQNRKATTRKAAAQRPRS